MQNRVSWVHIEDKMKSKFITVLTPVYNRAELLLRCYESLNSQTNKEFEWLIVDDGSTDNTAIIVQELIQRNELDIRYLKKNNGGKHTAVNYGVNNISSMMTLILDSDDMLTPDAIASISELYNKYIEQKDICGFTFLKQYPDGSNMGDLFPRNGRYNFIDWRVNGVVSGDQCDVFYTSCMKEYPFSEHVGERFIGESTSWIRMADKYDMICESKAIYIADYLEGGLTKRGRAMRIQCPLGGMEYSNVCMTRRCSLKRKVRSAILYNTYGKFAKKNFKSIQKESNSPVLTFIMRPVGVLLFHIWINKFKCERVREV